MGGHHHRSSSLKQSNKSHKSGRASKRSVNRTAGGKVQNNARSGLKKKAGAGIASKAKANRAHMAKQRRLASKDKILHNRRIQGRATSSKNAIDSPVLPRLVGIVSLSDTEGELECSVKDFLMDSPDSSAKGSPSSMMTTKYGKFKKEGHMSFLPNSSAFFPTYKGTHSDEDATVQAALDLSRVCDLVIFLIDGRDAHKTKDTPITGMNIGGSSSGTVSSSATDKYDYDHLISSRGDRVLSALKAQGLPSAVTVLVNFEGDSDDDEMSLASCQSFKSVRRTLLKRKTELKKYVSRFATTEFGEGLNKAMELDLPAPTDEAHEDMSTTDKSTILISGKSKKILPDALINNNVDEHPSRATFIRAICTMRATPPKWVTQMPRSYLLSDGNCEANGYSYDESTRELKITGFIRGQAPWNVNSLVHVPNVGTFHAKSIEKKAVPNLRTSRTKKNGSGDEIMGDDDQNTSQIITSLEESEKEPLNMFANPDALEGEQNLIGFDEDGANEYDDYDEDQGGTGNGDKSFKKGIARPAGWSDYQSAWLDALPLDADDDDEAPEEEAVDHGELAFALNKKSEDTEKMDMDEAEANDVTARERQQLLEQRQRDQEEDGVFPDEVEVDEDTKAGDRFARYRSLKSFRKSFWDPKENLPLPYGTIYHFSSFRATQADVMADMKDVIEASADESLTSTSDESMMDADSDEMNILEGCVRSGSYVTLTLGGVSMEAFNRVSTLSLITAVNLLTHENKMAVLHMGLSQTTQCDGTEENDLPVKSKDVLTFRCGWRTWQSRPIFSQNNLNSDKHKFERFMPTGGAFFAASMYGPVTYTPCPVLVFRKQEASAMQMVALGSMLGADADRIVVKRIVLTGYPTRVHKRNATVKYMFYNPDDVKWFKPAGITTKHGLQGNIIDSIGEHGTMKCLFNAPIKQHDTVCLPLYKRIFPKFAPLVSENGQSENQDILIL